MDAARGKNIIINSYEIKGAATMIKIYITSAGYISTDFTRSDLADSSFCGI